MTQASKECHLSKLDLFTPNVLHPTLSPLATGLLSVMGDDATMIARDDVLTRRDYIYSLLGDKAKDTSFMRKRTAAHQRITQHLSMRLTYGSWYRERISESEMSGPKSMRTAESRRAYAEKALEKEWAAMGIQIDGQSKDTAIELD